MIFLIIAGALVFTAIAGIVVIAVIWGDGLPFRDAVAWTARGFLKGFCGYKTPKLKELEARMRERGVDIWKRPRRREKPPL